MAELVSSGGFVWGLPSGRGENSLYAAYDKK